MPIQLVAPLYKVMTLERADITYENKEVPTTVTIRQARQHEHEKRQLLFKRLERSWSKGDDPDEVRLVQEISMLEVYREEAWLTLCECNMTGEDGKLVFPSRQGRNGQPELAMNRDRFNEAWGSLFPDIADEIVEKIHEVNLLWGGTLGEGAS